MNALSVPKENLMPTIAENLQSAFEKHGAGDTAGATTLYRAVLAEAPEQPDALHMLGVIAMQNGNRDLALKLMEAALAKNPDLALAWHNRCLVLRALHRQDEALESAWQALALDPKLADAWDMAGSILREKRQFAEACACLERAVTLKPGNVAILNSYVVVLTACGRLADAWRVVQRMKAENIDNVAAFTGIGNLLKAAGYPGRAVPWLRKALDLKPDFTGGRLNEAMAYLQMGDMENGLALWERRLEDPERKPQPAPTWNGDYVEHLLLREDQGMGDALQCVRYIPLIQKRAGRITLQLTGFLKNLLAPNLPGVSIITLDDPTPAADATAQLMSLPALCGTRVDTIPASVPYIRAEEVWRAPWRERLKHLPKPHIGLVWGGNPGNRHDYNRALNFSQLAPIIKEGPAHFVALQKGPQSVPAELAASGVFDAAPLLDDFTATCGLMAELDLVITICSSPVHLAGAMGRPTFLMLCFDPHWVWLLGRQDTPWYLSVRLFRQNAPGDWEAVTARVASEVRKLIAGDRSVLSPPRWSGAPLTQNPQAINLPE
jgi:tetratricopeptide (TPR) repeat protein